MSENIVSFPDPQELERAARMLREAGWVVISPEEQEMIAAPWSYLEPNKPEDHSLERIFP